MYLNIVRPLYALSPVVARFKDNIKRVYSQSPLNSKIVDLKKYVCLDIIEVWMPDQNKTNVFAHILLFFEVNLYHFKEITKVPTIKKS